MDAEITVIIPTRNRLDILMASLKYLFIAVQHIAAEVIVVNDGDETVYKVLNSFPSVVIIENPGRGVAAARNAGGFRASAKLLLFLDDDMWMTKEAIEGIIRFHARGECVALNVNWTYPAEARGRLSRLAFGRYLLRHRFDSLKGWHKDSPGWEDESCFRTTGVTSQNLSMLKSCFQISGGYNEKFPHAGFEDYEFSKRLVSLGVPIFIDPTLMTFHNEEDRLALDPWMQRRERGGETRRVAVALGYAELALEYKPIKKTALTLIAFARPLLNCISANYMTNRFAWLDPFTFRVFDALFATAIFKGYSKLIRQIKP